MRPASLPMYEAPARPRFWAGLRGHLRGAGLAGVPDALAEPADLPGHWRDPDLLLSQTCGYPFATALAGAVRYVATPCYAAEGCEGPAYRSLVVVREDDAARGIADLRGRRAAVNARDSQSGCNALRALVAPLARDGRFFGAVVESGAHRRSLDLVREGAADVAAVDCVTAALARRHAPARMAGLRVLARTAPGVPGLPLVTARRTSDADLARLRAGLAAAAVDPTLAEARADLLLVGFAVLPEGAYAACRAMEAAAAALGYPDLA